MADKNTAAIGFEKQIWDAACVLRGNLDASEYKSVVLGLIFLKYISDRFDDKYRTLVEEGDGFEEDIDEYTSEGIFFVPARARWREIAAKAHSPEIGTVIDDAMRAIEKENKRLKDILPKNFARPELDKRRLGDVVDLFTNIQMIEHGSEKDILGRTYEYCLSMFAEQEGKRGGEFFTPSCVVRTLVEILKPFKGRVYDPCCGSGGMFVQSARFVENHSGNISNISIYGQDSNPTTWKMAQMNLAIRGIEPDLGAYAADTFLDDRHPTLRADYIMANPPFNLSDWGADKLKDDVRFQYGMPPAGNANFAWLQHMIYHLAPTGRIGMVLANGSLSSQSGGEGDIRKNIVNADLVECIIAMPTQLFYTTQIPVSLWFLNKQKKQTGKTLFIDARRMGTMVSRKLRELTDEDIQKLADTYSTFVDRTLEDEKGYCAVAETAEIEKQDYILTPGRYVGIEEQEDDGEPFEDKMNRLTSELSEMFEKSHEAVRSTVIKITYGGTGGKSLSLNEINDQINNLLKSAVQSEGVINLFDSSKSGGENFSLFDPAVLDEISRMKEKNIAVEILKKLMAEQVALYKRTNIVQSQQFSEKIAQLMNSYYNGLITNEEVIKELLKTAQEIADLYKNGQKLGLSQEELAFYDALTKPEHIKDFYQNDDLINLTKELTEMLRKNRTIDWQKKETARAQMRKMVKRLLKKYHYPPEDYDFAIHTVISQCELWTDNEDMLMPGTEEKNNVYFFQPEEEVASMVAEDSVPYGEKK